MFRQNRNINIRREIELYWLWSETADKEEQSYLLEGLI